MSDREREPVTITLSPSQVDAVVRAARNSRVPSVAALVNGALAAPPSAGSRRARETSASANGHRVSDDDDDARLSRSLMRGLSLLGSFGPDRAERGIVELAGELGMSPSTVHRYAVTLVELGLLERCPRTRKYRLAAIA
jgi:IclR helix-turn-helix domain